MMTENTSPYIFPFHPFKHLEIAEPNSEIVATEIWDIDRFEPLLDRFAPTVRPEADGTPAERILAIFTSDEILFGEKAFIESWRDHWIAKIEALIAARRPVDFTILGYPFKMPVPLKTNRRCADFGEAVSLARLAAIARAVSGIHAPGARVHVFTEGAFGAFNDVDRAWSDRYFASLETMVAAFGLEDAIVLHDLNVVVDETPEFKSVWSEIEGEIEKRRDAGDPATLKALGDALPVRFHNLSNFGVGEDLLRRAYLDDGSADADALRRNIMARAKTGVVSYRAFLEARDRIGLLERYAPGALAMTVSPRAGRLGVRPLPAPSEILPYHGVPVLTPDRSQMRIEYLWDLMGSKASLTAVHWSGDSDNNPFMYIEV